MEYPCMIWELLKLCRTYILGIEQMPCPEFVFAGYPREACTKTQYEKKGLRRVCSKLANVVVEDVVRFLRANLKVVGIVGVARSPSCGVSEVYVGDLNKSKLLRGAGIFIEEIQKTLDERNLNIQFLEWDFRKPRESLSNLASSLLRL